MCAPIEEDWDDALLDELGNFDNLDGRLPFGNLAEPDNLLMSFEAARVFTGESAGGKRKLPPGGDCREGEDKLSSFEVREVVRNIDGGPALAVRDPGILCMPLIDTGCDALIDPFTFDFQAPDTGAATEPEKGTAAGAEKDIPADAAGDAAGDANRSALGAMCADVAGCTARGYEPLSYLMSPIVTTSGLASADGDLTFSTARGLY